ncbi:MAG TPA: metallophosphoesterase family protein [Solirubrobacterales bacterium]|nr:metallophosphoesterase family protein [Solirubrobacterales bacterium]
MLIAILSDTHMPRGRRRLPDACTEAIRTADLLIHVGDIAAVSTLRDLACIGPPLRAVHGNVDTPELKRKLPERLELSVDEVALGIIHDAGAAAGRAERLQGVFPEAAAVIFGHTHVPHHEGGSFQIFNPGSPTERRRAPHRSMGLAEVRGGRIAFRHLVLT